jgi:hypothetical protein
MNDEQIQNVEKPIDENNDAIVVEKSIAEVNNQIQKLIQQPEKFAEEKEQANAIADIPDTVVIPDPQPKKHRKPTRLERENLRLEQMLAEQHAIIEELAQKAEHAEYLESAIYQNELESVYNDTKEFARLAEESDDPEQRAEANALLAEMAAKKALIEKDQEERAAQRAMQRIYSQQNVGQLQEQINPNLIQFVERNAWANPNNTNYDTRLVREAEEAASILDSNLKVTGQSHLIGTPEYFLELESYITNKYAAPARQAYPVQERPTYNASASYRPSSNNIYANSSQRPTNYAYQLTATEKKMAEKAIDDPNMSREEKWLEYAKYKSNSQNRR